MGLFDFFKKKIMSPSEQSLHQSNFEAPTNSDYIERWKNRERPILKTRTLTEMSPCTNLPYDFTDCPVIYHPFNQSELYLISIKNQPQAGQDILNINSLLEHQHKVDRNFPLFHLTKNHLRFQPDDLNNLEVDDFSHFHLNPTTPTRRVSKFPLSIDIRTLSNDEDYRAIHGTGSQSINGCLYYLQDGSVGKIELSCWKKGKHYPFNWTK